MKHLVLLAALLAPALAEARAETRCGWFVNPTPANMWLTDAAGDWIVSTQGIGPVPGFDDLTLEFGAQWIAVNGSYGYGCACLKGDFGAPGAPVAALTGGRVLPLAKCAADPALPRTP